MRTTFFVAAFLAFAVPVSAQDARPDIAPGTAHVDDGIWVHAGTLIDGLSPTPTKDQAILIRDGRIVAIRPAASFPAPAGATVIDLSSKTVLPGLIDCHVHLSDRPDRYEDLYAFTDTPFDAAFAAVKHARATLLAGFTTVRDVGSPPFLAVDLRNAIDDGRVLGPRIVASGPMISISGGHADLNDFSPETRVWLFPDDKDFSIADSPDEMRKVVREQMKYGVDVIKIAASGGVFSRGDTPGAPAYTLAELQAGVEAAHAGGRKVAVHAHGAESIKRSVLAGVDSVEHGSLIDDEGIRLMKQHGTFLVDDVYDDDWILSQADALHIPEEYITKEKGLGKLQRENFHKAVVAGVRIAFGTDAGVYPHGDNAKQFAWMVKLGMTPMAAIRAATSDAAELLGRNDVGAIEVGRDADLIAVDDDPLSAISVLEQVPFVMKGGRVVKGAGAAPASPLLFPPSPPQSGDLYVRAGRLFDGTGDGWRRDVVVAISGGRIATVTPAASAKIPPGARVIDLSDDAVLPGLIDCHVHLSAITEHEDPLWNFKDTPFSAGFAAAIQAEKTLAAGFTTVRDVGSPPFLGVDLRKDVDEGFVRGPRVVAAGPPLTITGGHGDLNDFAPETQVWMFPAEKDFAVADGPEQVRHAVRAQVKYGVDWIKILASGGVLSRGDEPGAPQYSLDELTMAATEAHKAGRKIAAHAHGATSIKWCVQAGIDTIEHGSLIDDEGIRMMKERGTWLVPDLYDGYFLVDHAKDIGLTDAIVKKALGIRDAREVHIRAAMKAGVKIAFGTDAGVYPNGDNAKQFAYLVRFGMTPAAAIRAATSDAAQLLGRDDVGRVAPGAWADLIAVRGDPLSDVTVLEDVPWVMQGGVVEKDRLAR